jgi:hypothetical protein
MIRGFAPSAVDCGFELRSNQMNDYSFDICCFSGKHAAQYNDLDKGTKREAMLYNTQPTNG